MEMDRSNPKSVKVHKHRLGRYLRSKDWQFLRNVAQESVITNTKQVKPKKSADFSKDNYGDRSWNFVKLINEVLKKWKIYGKSRILPSIRSRDENSEVSEHCIGTPWPNTGTAKWSKLYERSSGFSGCWINTQWKFPRDQSTSVIPTSSNTWRDV